MGGPANKRKREFSRHLSFTDAPDEYEDDFTNDPSAAAVPEEDNTPFERNLSFDPPDAGAPAHQYASEDPSDTDDTPANGQDDAEWTTAPPTRPGFWDDVKGGAGAAFQGFTHNYADDWIDALGSPESGQWLRDKANEYPMAHGAGQMGLVGIASAAAPITAPYQLGVAGASALMSSLGDQDKPLGAMDAYDWGKTGLETALGFTGGALGYMGGKYVGQRMGNRAGRQAEAQAAMREEAEQAGGQMRAYEDAQYEPVEPGAQQYDLGPMEPTPDPSMSPPRMRSNAPDPYAYDVPEPVVRGREQYEAPYSEGPSPLERGSAPVGPSDVALRDPLDELLRGSAQSLPPEPAPLLTPEDGASLVRGNQGRFAKPVPMDLDTTTPPGYGPPAGPYQQELPFTLEGVGPPEKLPPQGALADPNYALPLAEPNASPAPYFPPQEAEVLQSFDPSAQPFAQSPSAAPMPNEATRPGRPMAQAQQPPPLPPQRAPLPGGARPPADLLDSLLTAPEGGRPPPLPPSGKPPAFAMEPAPQQPPALDPDMVPNAQADMQTPSEPPQLPLNALARGAGALKDFAFGGALGKMRALGEGASLVGDAMKGGTSKYPLSKGGYMAGATAVRGAWDIGLPAATGSKVNAQDNIAYAGGPTSTWAVQSVLAAGDTGMAPDDEQRLADALASGDHQRVSAADYRLRQRYPRYAQRVEKTLRDLNDQE